LFRYGELRITFDNSKVEISIPEKAIGKVLKSFIYRLFICIFCLSVTIYLNPSITIIHLYCLELKSSLGAGGRGMELSELSVYNDKLYTVDDRNVHFSQLFCNISTIFLLLIVK
jgi:hypothetical protein